MNFLYFLRAYKLHWPFLEPNGFKMDLKLNGFNLGAKTKGEK